jgi:hypothetical protein
MLSKKIDKIIGDPEAIIVLNTRKDNLILSTVANKGCWNLIFTT